MVYRTIVQVAVPEATEEAGEATASDAAALSRCFLKDWQAEGCPGKPATRIKRQLAPDRKVAVGSHSLYSRTAVGDAVSAAAGVLEREGQAVEEGNVVAESPAAAKKQKKLLATDRCVVGSRRDLMYLCIFPCSLSYLSIYRSCLSIYRTGG